MPTDEFAPPRRLMELMLEVEVVQHPNKMRIKQQTQAISRARRYWNMSFAQLNLIHSDLLEGQHIAKRQLLAAIYYILDAKGWDSYDPLNETIGKDCWKMPMDELYDRGVNDVVGATFAVQVVTTSKEPTTMKHRNMITLLQSGYKTIDVVFAGTHKSYVYKVSKDIEVKAGDVVVVPAAGQVYSEQPVIHTVPYNTALVKAVHEAPNIDLDAPYEYKWIVDVVRDADYLAQLDRETEMRKKLLEVERAAQRDELMNKIRNTYPEGSEARAMFDKTIEQYGTAKVIEHVKDVD